MKRSLLRQLDKVAQLSCVLHGIDAALKVCSEEGRKGVRGGFSVFLGREMDEG